MSLSTLRQQLRPSSPLLLKSLATAAKFIDDFLSRERVFIEIYCYIRS